MPRANDIQTNFTSGEISPFVKGRVDIDRYNNGVAFLENFIVYPQGGITRRTGTKFLGEVKTSATAVRIQEFIFSETQTYILEFGDLYVRFWSDGALVEDPPATPIEIITPWSSSELSDLYFSQSGDVIYVAHPDYRTRKISRTSHVTWTISELIPKDGPYLSVNDDGIELTVSNMTALVDVYSDSGPPAFDAADVGEYFEYRVGNEFKLYKVDSVTDANNATVFPVLNTVAPLDPSVTVASQDSGPPTTLTLTSTGVWNIDVLGFWFRASPVPTGTPGTPYWYLLDTYDAATPTVVKYSTATTITPIVNATGDLGLDPLGNLTFSNEMITCTVTAATAIFAASDATEGRPLRVRLGGQWFTVTITGFTSSTVVTGTLDRLIPLQADGSNTAGSVAELADNGKTTTWRLGALSAVTGWPSVVTFYEQRLVLSSNTTGPNTTWMSKSADFENFEPSIPDTNVVAADNAITFTLASGQINQIEWLQSGPVLLAGTLSDEWPIRATLLADPVTPSNLVAKSDTNFGTHSLVIPERINSAVLFAQRSGEKIIELLFDDSSNSYVGRDLTLVSEHILRDGGGAIEAAYQRERHSIYWLVMADGSLVAMTYLRDQQVFAWHRHVIAGSFDGGAAVVESIAVIPSAADKKDEVYLVVKRTINSVTERNIEVISPDFYPTSSSDKDDMRYLDSFITYSGVSTSTITGLDHLEGESVVAVNGGSMEPAKTVASGQISLDYPGTMVHVGLQYTSTVKTLTPEAAPSRGNDTSQTDIRRFISVGVRLWRSVVFEYGTDESNLVEWNSREENDPMDASPEMITDDRDLSVPDGYNLTKSLIIKTDSAYPLTILAIVYKMEAHGR